MFLIILGGGIDLSGHLPSHVYQRLDYAANLFQQLTKLRRPLKVSQQKEGSLKIVVCGKHSFLYNQIKKYPATTEAEAMTKYLVQKGISKKDILLEKKSKDTIGNAYYLKKDFFLPKNEKKAMIITSHFHLTRVKYIFQKVFGPNYHLEFVGVKESLSAEEEKKVINHQYELLKKIKQILSPMKDGDHCFLTHRFYKIKYYR